MPPETVSYPEWRLFLPEHVATLVLAVVLTLAFVWRARSAPGSKGTEAIRRTLAVLLFLTYPVKLLGFHLAGYAPPLPMHVCDWAAYSAAMALTFRKVWLAEIAYFWGVGATLQGLVTPAIDYGFPHPVWFTSVHLHLTVVLAAFFLVFGLRMTPGPWGKWRALGALHIYLAAAWLANMATGHNYGFLRAKPPTGSLFDVLPPEPWHIFALEPVAILVFLLLDIPFWRLRRRSIGRKAEQSETKPV